MDRLPQRTLLNDQVAEVLRGGISSGRWVNELPGEMELCRDLQVSRSTLRRAMKQLVHERWIEPAGRGSHHRILQMQTARPASKAKTIRVLTPFSYATTSSTHYLLFESLAERMAAAGYRVTVEYHPGVYEIFRDSTLARLNALPDTAAWVLFHTTEPIQRWFATCGRPTMVIGRVYGDLALSTVYPDGAASGRHAAGRLVASGYHDLVYLTMNQTTLGDQISAKTFVVEAVRLGARARIVTYDGHADAIGKAVKSLLLSRPRPTGYVIADSDLVVTVLCHLLAAGIKVPAEAAIIGMWDDKQMDATYPTIARYRCDGKLMGRKIGKSLIDLIRHGTGKIHTVPIIPDFIPGGSVKSSPA